MAYKVAFRVVLLLVVLTFVYGGDRKPAVREYHLFRGLSKESCVMPRYVGPCHKKYPSYYFDIESRECKPFNWSGCGGNSNRFYTLEECQFACSYYRKSSA